jgi:ATP-dependent RNA helicase RhlE
MRTGRDDFNALSVHTPLTGAAIYGGVGMGPQEHAFRTGVDVIVATPGRLLDHATRPYATLSGLEYLVLDEADRMLDMEFLPAIKRILRHISMEASCVFRPP